MGDSSVSEYIIRCMTPDDREKVLEISSDGQFNVGTYENIVMSKVDPMGLFVAEKIGTGKIIGVCLGIIHSKAFAFIGLYVVSAEYQGKGIGQALWREASAHIGKINTGIVARENMAPIYRDRCGFIHTSTLNGVSYCGVPKCDKLINNINGISVVKVNSDNLHKVIQYDGNVCDALVRNVFLEECTKVPETVFIAAINDNTNDVNGFCIMMKSNFNTGLIQSLYADNVQIAELLIGKCCELMPIALINGIYVRTFDNNKSAKSIINKLGLNYNTRVYYMFTEREIYFNTEITYFLSPPSFYHY